MAGITSNLPFRFDDRKNDPDSLTIHFIKNFTDNVTEFDYRKMESEGKFGRKSSNQLFESKSEPAPTASDRRHGSEASACCEFALRAGGEETLQKFFDFIPSHPFPGN